jgi:uncharacterized membrane-anchored protein YhcB (DUF1043 family)
MPSFKPKNTKKYIAPSNTTLDEKHREFLDSFAEETRMLPHLRRDIKKLKSSIMDDAKPISEVLDIKDRIKCMQDRIKTIKRLKNQYLLNNSKYIFEYFENKKETSEGKNKTTILNNFFNIKNDDIEKNFNAITNVRKYLTNIDDTFLDVNNFITTTEICQSCRKGELIPEEHEGIIVCNNCSASIKYLVENDKPSFKEPPKEVCFYAYKRINHFREILAQFQAKETTLIPDEVLENIKLQIKKERISLEQITNKSADNFSQPLKDILKKLGYNKYYEHIPFIKDKLGIKPPIMSAELEERLCNHFTDIQGPYAKYCPDNRVNFLNYYYTVYKLCELLDQRQFLAFFPMLKDPEKRIEQDEIWKKICNELDWEFIPTI